MLVTDDAPPRLLERVLIASGPVPFRLKTRLYAKLINDEHWHYFIYRSLLHSTFDIYGEIEQREVIKLLAELKLPPEEALSVKHIEKELRDRVRRAIT